MTTPAPPIPPGSGNGAWKELALIFGGLGAFVGLATFVKRREQAARSDSRHKWIWSVTAIIVAGVTLFKFFIG